MCLNLAPAPWKLAVIRGRGPVPRGDLYAKSADISSAMPHYRWNRAADTQQNHDVEHAEVSISVSRQQPAPAVVRRAGVHVQRCLGGGRAEDTTEQGRFRTREAL